MIIRFGFTDRDSELIREDRSKDPLGLQPVWGYFGRQLIPNLTEQTKHASGFWILACILYLYEQEYSKWANDKSDRKTIPVEDFYILAEQLFAYSSYHHQKKWRLPGSNELKYHYEQRKNGVVIIGHNRELVGSQIAGGTWGLYRGAARRSKILDDSERLSALFLSEFKRDQLPLTPKRAKDLFAIIQAAQEFRYEGWGFNVTDKLSEQLSQTMEHMGSNAEVIYKYLIGQGTLLDKVVRDYKNNTQSDRAFLSNCRQKYSEQAYIFEDIIKCEDYIGTLDSTLQFLYAYAGKPLKTACNDLPLSTTKIRQAYDQFMRVSKRPSGETAAERYDTITSLFEVDTKENFARWLLRLHAKIAEGREGTPWIELDDADRIRVNIEYDAATELTVTPGNGWKNKYYMDSLLSVFKGLR